MLRKIMFEKSNFESTSGSPRSSKLSSDLLAMPSPKRSVKGNNKKLGLKIATLRKKLNSRKSQIYRLRKKKSSSGSTSTLDRLLSNKSHSVKTFVKMQLYHKKRTSWSKDEKQLALSLYYKSPGNYKHMIEKLKFCLPSVRVIQSWLKILYLRTGVNNTLSRKLALKAKTMTDRERTCAVMFDEIALKKQLEFNISEDVVEGYQDLASLGKEDKIGNTALVFFIRGLFNNWKIPFCYFISAGPVKSPSLQHIIVEVIRRLRELTFNPMVLVCDQGSNNRSAMKLLGASSENPAITIDEKKIFTCFDVPHLLKSLRNNFINPKLKFVIDNVPVSWSDVTKTYEIDQNSNTTRAMLKIGEKHLYPTNFQKMRVKYAAQTFSNSVAAAVETAARTNQLQSSTSLETAKFIRKINDIFDSLNSRVLNDPNPKKRALSIYNTVPQKILENALLFFKSIEVFENGTGGKKRNNIFCLDGFLWTINSILSLWSELKCQGIKYLLTSFLNQDPLENFFSVVRHRGGYNPTPSVRQCRIAIQHNMNIRLQMAVDTGNCQIEDTDLMELPLEDLPDQTKSQDDPGAAGESRREDCRTEIISVDNEENQDVGAEEINTAKDSEKKKDTITLETCSNIYVAGYLINKIVRKTSCHHCVSDLLKDGDNLLQENEFLILSRDYACSSNIQFLKRPSEDFSIIVSFLLQEFNKSFDKHKCGLNVKKNIELDLFESLERRFRFLENCENPVCVEHRKNMVKLLIKMKIYRNLKWESDRLNSLKSKDNVTKAVKPHRKVKILSSQ